MNRIFLVLTAALALWAAACSGGGSLPPLPPPTGNYSLSSLNGTYAFVTSGQVATSGGAVTNFVRTGSFIADGQGRITGGVEDVNTLSTAGAVVSNDNAIANTSTYTVNADGRGTMTLDVTSNGIPATINFAIVVTSTSSGLLMDETSNSSQASTGSGNFIKQNTSLFAASTVNGTYVFDFSGIDAGGSPLSILGEIKSASSGIFSSSFEDSNDGDKLTSGSTGAGSFTSDPADATSLTSFGRGVVTIAGESYIFYIVDQTRVRLINNLNGGNMLTGDAVLQDNTVPTSASSINSAFAYILAGSGSMGGLTRVGRFTSTAGSLSQVHQDTNNNGSFILTNISGNAGNITLDAANPGRGTLTITDPSTNQTFTAVFYLSSSTSGVIQETTVVKSTGLAAAVDDGSILAQTGTFSSSTVMGPYAFNWSGVSTQGSAQAEEDCLGEATAASLKLSGAADLFEFSDLAPVPGIKLQSDSAITIGGDGTTSSGTRNTMSIHFATVSSPVTFVVYFVNPQLAFFANNTSGGGRVVAGILEGQH